MRPAVVIHPAWFFMAGCLLIQLPPTLASGWASGLVAGTCVLIGVQQLRWHSLRQRFHMRCGAPLRVSHSLALALGFAWAAHQAEDGLSQRLPQHLEGERVAVQGFVASLVRHDGAHASASFALQVTGCTPSEHLVNPDPSAQPGPPGPRPLWCPIGHQLLMRVSLDRHDPQVLPATLRAGSAWHAEVRLAALHAQRNPGGRDLELLALQSGWVAKGRARWSDLRPGEDLAAHPLAWIHRSREAVQQALRQSAASHAGGPVASARAYAVIEALVIGSGEGLDPEQWNAFNRTGVGHLLSISGSHVTMFSGLSACLGVAILGWIGALGWTPLRWATMALPRLVFAAGGAVFYTLLAGCGLPAQRTCAMVVVTGLLTLCGGGRQVQPVLAWAGLVVCLIDPWAVISPGFWLSFAAVSALVWSGQLRQRPRVPVTRSVIGSGSALDMVRDRWRLAVVSIRPHLELAVRGQWAASVVMIPLSVLFFAQISWIAPLANALAIPWITLVVTPLSLLFAFAALLCSTCTGLPLAALAWATEQSLVLLDALATQDWISAHATMPPLLVVMLGVLACAILLWPLAPWPRSAAALLLVPTMFWPSPHPAEGELDILFLDVGQGSAVIIRNRTFSLIYDAGPAIDARGREDGRNAGFQVVLPVLRSWGLHGLDALVVSHADLDHAGGALSLHRHLRIGRVLSGSPGTEPALRSLPVEPCDRSTSLVAGETTLRFLHPESSGHAPFADRPAWLAPRANRNAHSCVLLVSHRGRHILLPGDLPSLQESAVLLREPEAPAHALDVLVLGHHGAASSSSAPWLDYWRPAFAVAQAGYANRYGHPDPATIERLQQRAVTVRRTDLEGALWLRIASDGSLRWSAERDTNKRYWTR